MPDGLAFSGSPLDRASQKRTNREWVDAQLADPQSRFLPVWKLSALVKSGGEPSLAWARRDVCDLEGSRPPVLLGIRDEVAHFAVDISATEKPEAELGVEGAAQFSDARALASQLPVGEAAIFAQARALVDWHATHGFCAKCGESTRISQGGTVRICPDCQTEHFPRVNPVVIMVVTRGDNCLLGRQKGWPVGMFSALAGFVEQGETIEEAVRREVMEEAGVSVGNVRYHASQPWPFPSSLMLGCIAQGVSQEIVVDFSELEAARWFSRQTILETLAEPGSVEGLFVPPPMSIAHHLVRDWARSSG